MDTIPALPWLPCNDLRLVRQGRVTDDRPITLCVVPESTSGDRRQVVFDPCADGHLGHQRALRRRSPHASLDAHLRCPTRSRNPQVCPSPAQQRAMPVIGAAPLLKNPRGSPSSLGPMNGQAMRRSGPAPARLERTDRLRPHAASSGWLYGDVTVVDPPAPSTVIRPSAASRISEVRTASFSNSSCGNPRGDDDPEAHALRLT